jgi:hypothetical protein
MTLRQRLGYADKLSRDWDADRARPARVRVRKCLYILDYDQEPHFRYL